MNLLIKKRKFLYFGLYLVLLAFALIVLKFEAKEVSAGSSMIGGPHDFRSTGPGGQNFQEGVCSQCHIPHKAMDARLWKRASTVPLQGGNDSRIVCLDCHGYDNLATDLPILPGVNWSEVTPPRITSKDGTKGFPPYDADFHTGQETCNQCHKHYASFQATCETCHGKCSTPENFIGEPVYGAPDYNSAGAGIGWNPWQNNMECVDINNANSHIKHLQNGKLTCAHCHFTTVGDYDYTDGWTLTQSGTHMNPIGTVNVASEYYNIQYDPSNTAKRCYESCHGTFILGSIDAPQWGGQSQPPGVFESCFVAGASMSGVSCHGGVEPLDMPKPIQLPDYFPNLINKAQFELFGHGLSNQLTYTGLNPGAGFNEYSNDMTSPGCLSTLSDPSKPTNGCHFNSAQHYPLKAANDPYRLGVTYAEDTNGLCAYCHKKGQDGATKAFIDTSHTQTTTHSQKTWGIEPKCVDCHDPHGDDNDYMIKDAISRDYGSTSYGSPSLQGGVPNMGITQADRDLMVAVELTLTVPGYGGKPGVTGDYYNSAPVDAVCQVCHSQNAVFNKTDLGPVVIHDFVNENFKRCTGCHSHQSGFSPCAGCHGYPPNDSQHYTHVIVYEFDCDTCHNDNMTWKNHPDNQANTREFLSNNIDFNFKDELWFQAGTTMLNNVSETINFIPAIGSSQQVQKSDRQSWPALPVSCNIGCHNPVISLPNSLTKNLSNSVTWIAGSVTCTDCHGDAVKDNSIAYKLNDAATHSSKHPIDPSTKLDCEICHDSLIYPMEKITIDDGGVSVDIYHTMYEDLQAPPAPFNPVIYVPLLDRDTNDINYYKLNVAELTPGVSYSLLSDPDTVNTSNMTDFCLNCHDGDDSDLPVFSLGGGAPNIERWTYWENSSHNTGGDLGQKVGCFGTATMPAFDSTVAIGCHGNGHGSKKVKLHGEANVAAGVNYVEEEEGLCYNCHKEGSGIVNWSLSSIAPLTGTNPVYTSSNDIQEAFSGGSRHPVNDAEQRAGYPELECTTCHAVHWVSGKWKDTPSGLSPISLPTQITNAKTDQTTLDLLFGEEQGEKARDYAASYGNSTGSETTFFDPDGYCCDGQLGPAVYFDPKDWVTSDQVADTATYCLFCHTDTSRVNPDYIIGGGCNPFGGYCNSWPGDPHGGSRAGLPYAGGDSTKWWAGDADHPNGCDRDAGVSTHFVRNNVTKYAPQAARERIVGINYVLICTDCHEAHGSPLGKLFRMQMNNAINATTGAPNLGTAGGGGNWNTTCNQCHWFHGGQHANGMSCGNASCHEQNSIHKGKKLAENFNSGIVPSIVLDDTDCSYPPNESSRIVNDLVLHWDFDEGSGTKVNNYYSLGAECTNCGGVGSADLKGTLTDNSLSPNGGSVSGVAWVPSTTPVACGTSNDYALRFDRRTGYPANVQLDYAVDATDGYPVKYGNMPVLQNPDEFTIEAWINPDPLTRDEGMAAGLNGKLRRDIITAQFWVKNYAMAVMRFKVDGVWSQDPNDDQLRFWVAVIDPNNSNAKVIHPTKKQGSFSYAWTPRYNEGIGIPIVAGQWQRVTGTWDGQYIRLYVGGKLADETDMGGGGTYIMSADPFYWGGPGNPGVCRHVTSPFSVGARSMWNYDAANCNGGTDPYDCNTCPNEQLGQDWWNNYQKYWVSTWNTFIGEIDDVKYYKRAIPPEEVACASCHTNYPMNSGSHGTHFTAAFGPQDQIFDPPPGTNNFINNCDNCHGAGASYGNHLGHLDCETTFADGETLYGAVPTDPASGTTVCDGCHGVDDLNNPQWRLSVKDNWRPDDYIMFSWVNDPGYCESCHDETPSTVNTELGTGGIDAVAYNIAGDEIGYTYGYAINGHGAPFASTDCTSCHNSAASHIDGSPGNKLRMANDPINPGSPYNPFIDDRICTLCHDGAGPNPGTTEVSTHSNIHNLGSSVFDKYEADFELRCIECHDTHGTTNLYMINTKIISTADGVERDVVFTSQGAPGSSGQDSYDECNEGAGDIDDTDDLCVICHMAETPPGSGTFVSTMTTHVGGDHTSGYVNLDMRGGYCISCHKHNYDEATNTLDGFMPRMHDRCLECHTPNGMYSCTPGQLSDVDSQFDGIGNVTSGNIMSQHIVRYVIDYGGATGDLDKIILNKTDIECKKCHGDKHPTPEARVVNVDDGFTTYSTSNYGGRTPDILTEFCLSCHDSDAGSGVATDIQLSGILPNYQLEPRGQGTLAPWNPNPPDPDPLTGLPTFAERYGTLFTLSGHGSLDPLPGSSQQFGPDYTCTKCHDYHGNTNNRLIKTLLGGDTGTDPYNYDGEVYNTYDDWCTYTCHYNANPRINDHTYAALADTESGDSRDAETEDPVSHEPTHPTSMFIPGGYYRTLVEVKASPYIGGYLSLDNDDVLCITCHDPHGTNPPNEADTQMIRMEWSNPGAGNVDLCNECHY